MIVLKDTEKEITPERLLSKLPGDNADMYEDDVEDLLDQIRDADALHPAAIYTAVTVDNVENDTIEAEHTVMHASLFQDNCKAGDVVYPCLMTVGTQLDTFAAGLDDPMLSYLQDSVMNICLNDALIEIASRIAKEHPGKRMMMVKPGVEGVCDFSEQLAILKWLDKAYENIGVTASENGFLRPGYSTTALLFLTDGECNYCEDWTDETKCFEFFLELNKIAGHI